MKNASIVATMLVMILLACTPVLAQLDPRTNNPKAPPPAAGSTDGNDLSSNKSEERIREVVRETVKTEHVVTLMSGEQILEMLEKHQKGLETPGWGKKYIELMKELKIDYSKTYSQALLAGELMKKGDREIDPNNFIELYRFMAILGRFNDLMQIENAKQDAKIKAQDERLNEFLKSIDGLNERVTAAVGRLDNLEKKPKPFNLGDLLPMMFVTLVALAFLGLGNRRTKSNN